MAKINHEEYKILKSLDDDWEWIARDSYGSHGGDLFAYSEKPYKNCDEWWWNYSGGTLSIDNHLFQFIQWEDEEPYNIAELIGEYESEESEAKILESDYDKVIDELTRYVDQPEEYVVIEKPAIPQFVADYIEECKGWNDDEEFYDEDNAIDLFGAMHPDNAGMSNKVHDYLVDNQETFARAWLDGYAVEEEPKYYIDLETAAYVAKWDGNGQVDIYTDGISGSDEYELHLTEKEIKDFDPRFWPFRKPVEELGE